MESSIITTSKTKEQQQFNLETRNKVAAELEELNNRQQQQQQQESSSLNTNTSSRNKFIKFVDGQRRRLAFMDFEKKQIQNKDFATGELIPDSYSTRYFFSVVDITDPNNPIQGLVWERGYKEAKTILAWMSKNYKVLDVERHGKPGDKLTSYYIYPAIDSLNLDLERREER
jgi:hypothetical protein